MALQEELMSAENEKKATDFCNYLEDGDLAKSVQYLAEDVDYQNVGMSQVKGHAGVRQMLDEWLDGDKNLLKKMDIKHTASSGNIVMNVRLETWALGSVTAYLPTMGMFDFDSDGKICRWHDYWDGKVLEALTAEMRKVRGVATQFEDHLASRASDAS
jgi:limonene-1,2-epoxide hydrolase